MIFQISTMRQSLILPLIAFSLSVAGCGKPPAKPIGDGSPIANPVAKGASVTLTGAGASFPAPLYQRWFAEYRKTNSNTQINYQSVGSGAGVKQFISGTVDFGASDVAMKEDEIKQVAKGVVLLPMTAGSIVLAYNLPELTSPLKLSRQVYADILLGKITKWNDPKIVEINPGVTLPDKPIAVVHRSDGSGTTAVFTKHLSAVSSEWKAGLGEGKSVEWPQGPGFVGAKGNEGVTAQIQQTEGALGYVEYGYAKEQKLKMAALENKAGKYVEPSAEAAAKTLAAVQLPENLVKFIEDPEGEASYPIVSYTWIMAYKQYDSADKAKALKDVLKWGLTDGQKLSDQLGYVPLPPEVVTKVTAAVETIKP
jgi:phosphate transport system substrate-binding protein